MARRWPWILGGVAVVGVATAAAVAMAEEPGVPAQPPPDPPPRPEAEEASGDASGTDLILTPGGHNLDFGKSYILQLPEPARSVHEQFLEGPGPAYQVGAQGDDWAIWSDDPDRMQWNAMLRSGIVGRRSTIYLTFFRQADPAYAVTDDEVADFVLRSTPEQ